MNCNTSYYISDEEENIIRLLLTDSIKAMRQSGALEKSLAERSSGDKAFWEIYTGAMFTKNQAELNELINANSNKIRKPDQKVFVFKNYYKEIVMRNVTIQMGMGGGFSMGIGDTRNYLKIKPSFPIALEFFYKNIGGGYTQIIQTAEKDAQGDFLNIFLINFNLGFRTLSLPHLHNQIYIGPTLIFTDLDNENEKGPLKSDIYGGINVSTAFDFYLTKPDLREIKKTELRLGLRVQAGISTYNTSVVKKGNGATFFVNIEPLLQAYETRLKEYGE